MDATVEPPTARLVIRGPSPLVGDVSDKTIAIKVEASLIDTRPPAKYIRTLDRQRPASRRRRRGAAGHDHAYNPT